MTIEDLENKYKIKLPDLYKQLYEDNMLFQEHNIPNNQTLRDNPTLLCHAFDFEQITINQIDEFIESKPDYWREDLLLIPFAHTGSGEWYAFYYNMQDEEEVPIVLLQLMSSALIMAKNLDDFIFRMILESACIGFYNYTQDDNGESEIKNRNSLIRMIQSHRKYLPIQRKLIIDEVFDKPLFYQNNNVGMISESELNDFFNETIAFEHLNYEFDYLID